MLLVRKHYAECSVPLQHLPRLQDTIRNIYFVNDLHVAFSEGVVYVFRKDKFVFYASTTSSSTSSCTSSSTSSSTSSTLLDVPSISRRIFRTTGSFPTLKTTIITFETSVTMSSATPTNLIFLDLLHNHVCKHPPPGTEINIFEPEIHPDVIVKVGFKDGFTVSFHFQDTGKTSVVCDATKCDPNPSASTFRTRAVQVIKSFHEDITWD